MFFSRPIEGDLGWSMATEQPGGWDGSVYIFVVCTVRWLMDE